MIQHRHSCGWNQLASSLQKLSLSHPEVSATIRKKQMTNYKIHFKRFITFCALDTQLYRSFVTWGGSLFPESKSDSYQASEQSTSRGLPVPAFPPWYHGQPAHVGVIRHSAGLCRSPWAWVFLRCTQRTKYGTESKGLNLLFCVDIQVRENVFLQLSFYHVQMGRSKNQKASLIQALERVTTRQNNLSADTRALLLCTKTHIL